MNNTIQYYHCTGRGSNATGYHSGDGFVVIKGSVVSESVSPSFECASKCYSRLRATLLESGVITGGVFQEDYRFSSPTAATAVVTGMTMSWRIAWVPSKASLLT